MNPVRNSTCNAKIKTYAIKQSYIDTIEVKE